MSLLGNLDTLNRVEIHGWAFDPDRPEQPVRLEIRCDDVLIGHVMADRYRGDLEAAGHLGDGCCSFGFAWPQTPDPRADHIIEVSSTRDGSPLPGSPATLRRSGTLDAACRDLVTQLLIETGAVAHSASELDDTIAYLIERADALLAVRSRLDGGERATVANLHDRWGGLAPSTSVLAIAPALRPRALFLDDDYPTIEDGRSNAVLDHMRSLMQLGFDVSFVPTRERDGNSYQRKELTARGITPLHSPWYGSVEEVLRRHAGRVDLVYLHRASNAALYSRMARYYCPQALLVYSVGDLHHLRLHRQAVIENRPELHLLAQRYQHDEITAARQVDVVITHSPAEAELLGRQLSGIKVAVVPWSVPIRPAKTPFAERSGVVFIGGFEYEPNVDAVYWLTETILPLIRPEHPSIHFRVFSSQMPAWLQQLAQPGLEIVHRVEPLEMMLDFARLTVAPLRYGAGLNGNVIESLAAGVPCIGTSIAFEGISQPRDLKDCVADEPSAIATALVRLYRDEPTSRHLAEVGKHYAMETHSVERVDLLMRDVVAPVLRRWLVAQ